MGYELRHGGGNLLSASFAVSTAIAFAFSPNSSLWRHARRNLISLAGEEGLEPPTPGFGDRCSNQLSYTPVGNFRG